MPPPTAKRMTGSRSARSGATRSGPGSTSAPNRTPAASPDAAWHIVRYIDGDSGEPLFAVFHRGRRHAWGLKDRAAAERWLTRKNVPVQQSLELDARLAG